MIFLILNKTIEIYILTTVVLNIVVVAFSKVEMSPVLIAMNIICFLLFFRDDDSPKNNEEIKFID